VATYSNGITVTWNAITFAEVTGLSWTYGGGPSKGRTVPWTDDAGSCTVTCLGSANTGTSNYGTRATLSITGGGQTLTTPAVWESLAVDSELNGVTRYTVTLKILDD
jgi:hypothetical protein